jgi:hypothetical protein
MTDRSKIGVDVLDRANKGHELAPVLLVTLSGVNHE